ncbi:MAG: VWA domain-containing protein [Bryobacteraceae bacterium]
MSLVQTLLLALLYAQQPETIRVPVRLVTVPTLVVSKQGAIIHGLSSKDFQIYDNGRRQKINLDIERTPLSVAVAVQVSDQVRDYLPSIANVGSVIDTLLLGDDGEAAVLAYDGHVALKKPFAIGDVRTALEGLQPGDDQAHMIEAGLRGIELLKQRPVARTRVLLLIGQPMDNGSTAKPAELEEQAERENVSIYALALPEFGKKFLSDTFGLQGLGSQWYKGGYEARVELTKLIPALRRGGKVAAGSDPFSLLTAATGGTQVHFRKQDELENAIIAFGIELRSAYLLSYSPDSAESGYHQIKVDVDVPDARTYSRPGYTLN